MVTAGFLVAYLIFDVDHYQAVSDVRQLHWAPRAVGISQISCS